MNIRWKYWRTDQSHADANSFIVFHKGVDIIKDGGNCWYPNPAYRNYFFQSQAHNVVLFNGEGQIKKIAVNGKIYEVDYNMGGDSIHSIIIDHHSHGVQISPSSNNSYTIMNKGELYQIELQGEMEKIHNARTAAESVGRQVVQAPMPGVILKTYVKKGDSVKRGDPLCVLVAMKMENEIRSVTDGVVKEVFVEDGMKVGLNDRIMVIE